MFRITVLFLCSLLSSVAFAQDKLRIKGFISGLTEDAKLTISAQTQEKEVEVNAGKFEAELQLDDAPVLVYFVVDQEEDTYHASAFLGNEEVELYGTINGFSLEVEVTNALYNEVYQKYEAILYSKEIIQESEQLSVDMMELLQQGVSTDSLYNWLVNPSAEQSEKFVALGMEKDRKVFDFLKEYINTPFGRYALKLYINDFSKEQLQALLDLVDPIYEKEKVIQFVCAFLSADFLIEGDPYIDFKALNTQKKEVEFHSFFDGRYVLLQFSTYNCSGCPMITSQIRELVPAYQQTLNFITYYVDQDREGLQEYSRLIPEGSHLIWTKKGALHPTLAKYRQIRYLDYFLFDPNGKLVAQFDELPEDFEMLLK